ncbi:MAG: rod shape-determining protein RodA [Proteobacteria bacterium]|uniref:rod shape-determining protein RodA n=1 Tax=Rudaea sp. TaxID=2136325 RepID=UPI003220514D|nr:rod shape-determining protein RodA [Pseudomonadota bacterium]
MLAFDQLGPRLRLFARRWLRAPALDWPLAFALVLLACVGLVNLYSAGGPDSKVALNQGARFVLGAILMVLLARVSPQSLRKWTPWLYAGSVFLLLVVAVLGEGRGAHRWLDLKVFRFQPSELSKLTMPMMAAWVLSRGELPPKFSSLAIVGVLIAIPAGLIAKQPDLGTALLVVASGMFVIFLAGLAWWRIGLVLAAAAAAAPVAWHFMHDYQKKRLFTFLDPAADRLGDGWHIMQSEIAVGSGGLWGKGWQHGTQSALEFLPEHTTDFAFAVFSEEWGLIGVAAVILLYIFIVGRGLMIAANARDTYSRLLAGSISMSFFVYVMVNGGMVAGILPVVGVPMPLISYGGTSVVALLAGFGVLMSIHNHRKSAH